MYIYMSVCMCLSTHIYIYIYVHVYEYFLYKNKMKKYNSLVSLYRDTKKFLFLFLFLYKRYFCSACEFWCIFNPKLIEQSIAIGIEHLNGYFYALEFFFGLYIYTYIYRYIYISMYVCLFLIFVRTTLSSFCINCPSLMSSLLSISFLIDSSITLGDFPSRFFKCFSTFFLSILLDWQLLV